MSYSHKWTKRLFAAFLAIACAAGTAFAPCMSMGVQAAETAEAIESIPEGNGEEENGSAVPDTDRQTEDENSDEYSEPAETSGSEGSDAEDEALVPSVDVDGEQTVSEPEADETSIESPLTEEEGKDALLTAEDGEETPDGSQDPEDQGDEPGNEPGSGEEPVEDPGEETEARFEVQSFKLNKSTAAYKAGNSTTIKATMVYEGDPWDSLPEKYRKITWSGSKDAVAKITSKGTVTVESAEEIGSDEEPGSDEESGSEGETGSDEETGLEGEPGSEEKPLTRTTVTQTVTVKGIKEGTAVFTASAPGGQSAKCTATIKPVPVALGKASNLRWDNTSTLFWNAVPHAEKYKITVTVKAGSVQYSDSVTISKRTNYDLESKIVSIIKAHNAQYKGAAFSVTATVQAIPTDTAHYKNGPAVKTPTLRYLRTTYNEAVSRNGWYQSGGSWYYYIAGKKQTGWIYFRRLRYYLDTDGKLLTDCWVGKRYVKSNGEMARDEWVDGYKYYVDSNGLKVEGAKFSTKNFVQNSKGWRYKKSDGTFIKNTWRTINHRVYYFDEKGYIKTGWFTKNGKKYHLKATGTIETGLGARETGWVKVGSNYYWCDEKGVLAKNQWVDRSQYYVGADGKRLARLSYQYLRNINTSNRLGYYVYNGGTAPEQSLAGFDLAYKNGNRILVVDLRFTKDNVPVCFHDDLVTYARNKNGSKPRSMPSVSNLTLNQLKEYDYGIYKGSQYKGTGVLTLEDMAKWLKSHTDADIYIEVKADKMNAAQISNTVKVLNKYGVTDRSSMAFDVLGASDTRAQRVHKAAPTLRIGLMAGKVTSDVYTMASKVKGAKNEVFLFCWATGQSKVGKTTLTQATVDKLRAQDILFECGTFSQKTSLPSVLNYYAAAAPYAYNSGVETSGAVIKNELMAATYHEKGKWVTVGNGRKYLQIDRIYAKNKWLTVSGKKYYFNNSAFMVTGWLSLSGKRYYLGTDGAMVTGWKTISGHKYYFDEDGAMFKGTQTIGSHTYKFGSNGWFIEKVS